MKKRIILPRIRFFLAVEGEGEQSFVKFLQYLCDQNGLHVHLDCQSLGGGGYRVMLERAVRYQLQKEKHKTKAKSSVLVVDADRAIQDDNWSLDQLRKAADKQKIQVCFQHPNLEGLLLRLLLNNERLRPNSNNAHDQLRHAWPDYRKPADARALISKFSLDDLLRVARLDVELEDLLKMIGLHM